MVILRKKWSCTHLFAGIRQCSPANGNTRFSKDREDHPRDNNSIITKRNRSNLFGPPFMKLIGRNPASCSVPWNKA